MSSDNTTNFKCICSTIAIRLDKKELIECMNCHKYQHKNCIKSFRKMDKYICPHCQFKYSDVCVKVIENLLPPSFIEYEPLMDHRIDYSVNIDIDKLKESKDFDVYTSFIVINCLQVNNTGFTFKWPLNTIIKVNNKTVHDVPENKTNNHFEFQPIVFTFCDYIEKKVTKFRCDYFPYNQPMKRVSEYILNSKETKIEISILGRIKSPSAEDYIISIDFIKVLNEDEIILSTELLQNKAKIKNLIKKNDDILFEGSKETVSLIDVYTGEKRIEIPSRGLFCNHLSVFDLKIFILMNRRRRKYKCAICSKNIRLLYIDGFILDLIKKYPTDNSLLLDTEYNVYSISHNNRKRRSFEVDQLNTKNNDIIINYNEELNKSQEEHEIEHKPKLNKSNIEKYQHNGAISKIKDDIVDHTNNNNPDKKINIDNTLKPIKNALIFHFPPLKLPKELFENNHKTINERLSEYIKNNNFLNYELLKCIHSDYCYKSK